MEDCSCSTWAIHQKICQSLIHDIPQEYEKVVDAYHKLCTRRYQSCSHDTSGMTWKYRSAGIETISAEHLHYLQCFAILAVIIALKMMLAQPSCVVFSSGNGGLDLPVDTTRSNHYQVQRLYVTHHVVCSLANNSQLHDCPMSNYPRVNQRPPPW